MCLLFVCTCILTIGSCDLVSCVCVCVCVCVLCFVYLLVCTFVSLYVVLSLTGEIFKIYLVGDAELSLNQLNYIQVSFLYGCVNLDLFIFFPVICLVLYLYINLHVTFNIIFLLLFYYYFLFSIMSVVHLT